MKLIFVCSISGLWRGIKSLLTPSLSGDVLDADLFSVERLRVCYEQAWIWIFLFSTKVTESQSPPVVSFGKFTYWKSELLDLMSLLHNDSTLVSYSLAELGRLGCFLDHPWILM